MRQRAAQVAIALVVTATAASAGEIPVNAAGSTYIYVSDSRPKAGETITVRVRATKSNTLTVTYDNTLLDPEQINASGYTKVGNKISFNGISGTITFRTIDQGTAGLKVTAADPSLAACSTLVRVSAKSQEGRQQDQQNQRQEEQRQEEQKPETPTFSYDGRTYKISDKFDAQALPFGFNLDQQKIQNQDAKVLTNPTLKMTLVFLQEADQQDASGHFFIYKQDGTVAPFYQLGSADRYLVLEAADPVSGLTATSLTRDHVTYPVYRDDWGNLYVYGQDQTGTGSWFSLNADTAAFTALSDIKTSLAAAAEEANKPEETSSGKSLLDKIKGLPPAAKIAGPLLLLLLLLATLMTALRRRKKPADRPETKARENTPDRSKEDHQAGVLSQDTVVYAPTGGQEEREKDESDPGQVESPEDDLSSENADASASEEDEDFIIEEEEDQEAEPQAGENPEDGGPAEEGMPEDDPSVEQALDSSIYDKVEAGRKLRLARIFTRSGEAKKPKRDASEDLPEDLSDGSTEESSSDLGEDASGRAAEEESAEESAEKTRGPLAMGDTTNLDPGNISVAAENKGSNDGVLEAVEAAVAYARRKAEQQAKEEAAKHKEDRENPPELQVLDLNDF